MILLILLILVVLVVAGLQRVDERKQRLLTFQKRRLAIRISEGPAWFLRGLFGSQEYSIAEEELRVIGEGIRPPESITTSNGVQVLVNNVSVMYYLTREDPEPFKGWRKVFYSFGWKPGRTLYAYSQIDEADVRKRIADLTLQHLRAVIPTYRYQEILGVSLEDNPSPVDRQKILAARSELTEKAKALLAATTQQWGITVSFVAIGDIDPNEAIQTALQAKEKAVAEKAEALVRVSAEIEQAKLVLDQAKAGYTLNDLLAVLKILLYFKVDEKAAEQTGNLGRLIREGVQFLKGGNGVFPKRFEESVVASPVPQATT